MYILDDEPLAIEILRGYLLQFVGFEIIGYSTNPIKSIASNSIKNCDVLFIDYKMPGLNGFQTIELLENQPLIVFTTAYDSHALGSFNFNTIDYLVKPIPLPRFAKCIEKIRKQFDLQSIENNQKIQLKDGFKIIQIPLNSILYIKSSGDYLLIHTKTKRYTHLSSLKAFCLEYQSYGIMRVHNSYAANTKNIISYSPKKLEGEGFSVPISRGYQKLVKETFVNKST